MQKKLESDKKTNKNIKDYTVDRSMPHIVENCENEIGGEMFCLPHPKRHRQ